MRVAKNDYDDRAGLRGYVHFNKYTHTHTPWEDQREWNRMTRMTRPDCAVMCNLINTHTHARTLRSTTTYGLFQKGECRLTRLLHQKFEVVSA